MPLTPADVHNVAFSKPPIGKRGYNEDEVDAFLDLVENELTRLIEENSDLRQRVNELDQELAGRPGAGAAPVPKPPKPFRCTSPSPNRQARARAGRRPLATPRPLGEEQAIKAARVLSLAQDTADRLTSTGAGRVGQVAGGRTCQRRPDLGDARREAETTVSEARQRADALLGDAQTRSETQLRQAQEKADALQADAERKHSEIMGTINQQRTVLEGRLEQLRTFEREYRTRLRPTWSLSSRSLASADLRRRSTPARQTTPPGSTSSIGVITKSAGGTARRPLFCTVGSVARWLEVN